MIVGDVGADQQNDVGLLQILIGSRRPVAAERRLVPGDRAGHAQRSVAVVIVSAEPQLHQLPQRVELFGDQLSGADHAQRIPSVARLGGPETLHHGVERFVPTDGNQLAIFA